LGKDIGSNWRRKKKTYITIGYRDKAKKNPQFPQDLFALPAFSVAREAVQQAGILDSAQQFIQERLAQVKTIAATVDLAHPVFFHLLQFLAQRSY
jgi:geranylgeranyl pyrophosphate synthase